VRFSSGVQLFFGVVPVLGPVIRPHNLDPAKVGKRAPRCLNGPLFNDQGNRGSIQTGAWVSDGLTFYLQDVTGGNPLTSDYTLATLVVHLQRPGQASLRNRRSVWVAGASAIPLLGLVLFGFFWRRRG
jgi:hypothetical protein